MFTSLKIPLDARRSLLLVSIKHLIVNGLDNRPNIKSSKCSVTFSNVESYQINILTEFVSILN